MKKLISIPIILCLLLIAGCEKSEDVTYKQLQTKQAKLQERQALIGRVIALKDAIQNKKLATEVRAMEIKKLVNDIERWNARPGVNHIALSTTEDQRGPRLPRQPCLLIPPSCAPITFIKGSICLYIGASRNCGPNGLRICKYACISDLVEYW